VLAAALAVATGACDGAGGDGGADGDGGPTGDASPGACGALPALSPSWLAPLLDEVVARLAGGRELTPGVTLVDRATPARRDAARAYLAGQLEALGLAPMIDDYGGGANVYAEIAPTEGEAASWIVLGAHLDTVAGSPGANDNATGVAAVLAAARFVAGLECRERGVIVAFLDQEEIGLVGSAAFADLLVGAELAVDSVHTIDQLGWDADRDRAMELELPGAGLLERYRAAAERHDLAVPLAATSTSTSDHQAFRIRGLAAVGLSEEFAGGDTTPHYHEAGDRPATVDLDYLAGSTALIHAVVGGFATGQGVARALERRPGAALDRLRAAVPARATPMPLPGWSGRRAPSPAGR
jgi:hypothetical protein